MSFDAAALSDAIAGVAETVGASVVRVEARRRGSSSGVIWSDDGLIVTASHTIERDESISVTLPSGQVHTAAVVGRDPSIDVALLRIDAKGLAAAKWAETDSVKVGHIVLALARPGKTVRATMGIVSTFGEGYRTPAGGKLDRYLQSDLTMQSGYSGGVLVDLSGRALGLNSSGILRGLSITVPTATLRRSTTELLAHGGVRRGYLGVGAYPVRLTPALVQQFNQPMAVVLVAIEPGSPADKSGLQLGDLLVTIDGAAIQHPGELVAALEDRAGAAITAKLVRAGATHDVKLTVGQRG